MAAVRTAAWAAAALKPGTPAAAGNQEYMSAMPVSWVVRSAQRKAASGSAGRELQLLAADFALERLLASSPAETSSGS